MTDNLLVFPADPGEVKIGAPAGWTVCEGEPEARAWRHYTSPDGVMLAGLWQCTPGAFDVVYDKWEFCHLISGSCTITPEGGAPVTLGAGDGFVLDPGFKGRWVVTETMTKHFVFRL